MKIDSGQRHGISFHAAVRFFDPKFFYPFPMLPRRYGSALPPGGSRQPGGFLGRITAFQSSFVMLYQHFLTVQGELVPIPHPKVMDLSGFLSYRLTSGPNPQLVREVCSLGSVIRFAYASMISAKSVPL